MLQFLLFSLAAALLYHSAPVSALSICYGNLGCFTDDPPYTNTLGVLPGSPAEVGTRFFLYTRASPYPEQLDYNFPANVNRSSFDPELPTKVIIHGYQNNLQTVWLSRMKDAFLATDEYNVILVGWGPGATTIVYPQSVSNTRIVARQLARLLLVLWQTKGLDLNSVHLIGFSLGAHLAGYVSRELGYKVGRITGLDPAGPLFQSFGEPIYLDRNDAIFVDIIHSNGLPGGAGTFISHGHVDFFSNGGAHQPGCEALGCSHSRSHELFISSIYATCNITSMPCASQESYNNGQCVSCGNVGCNTPGLYVRKDRSLGNQFFATSDTAPFCAQNYMVTIQLGQQLHSVNGELKVSLRGDLGYTSWVQLADGNLPALGDGISRRNVAFKENVGTVRAVVVLFTPAPTPDPAATTALASSLLGGDSDNDLGSVLASSLLGGGGGGSSSSSSLLGGGDLGSALASSLLGGSDQGLSAGAGLAAALLPGVLSQGDGTIEVTKAWVQPVPDGRPISTYSRSKLTPGQSTEFILQ